MDAPTLPQRSLRAQTPRSVLPRKGVGVQPLHRESRCGLEIPERMPGKATAGQSRRGRMCLIKRSEQHAPSPQLVRRQ